MAMGGARRSKLDNQVPEVAAHRRATSRPPQRKSKPSKPRPAPRSSSTYSSAPISRSAAAQRLASPRNYNPEARTLSFTTKKSAPLTLQVTAEIAAILANCRMDTAEPFTAQLRRQWKIGRKGHPMDHTNPDTVQVLRRELRAITARLGFQKRIVSHDLRRTAALRIHALTGDVTAVQALLGHSSLQSTIWYLDHDLKSISAATLEAMKKPFKPFRRRNSQ